MKTLHTSKHHIEYWQCTYAAASGRNEVVASCFVKIPGGLAHRVLRWEGRETDPPDVAAMLRDTKAPMVIRRLNGTVERHKNFSPRPYQLGQGCDGSIDSPVMALFYDWAKAHEQNPDELLAAAYPEETHDNTEWEDLIAFAEWQGVKYPAGHLQGAEKSRLGWDETALIGLRESLTEINYHSLVDVLLQRNFVPAYTAAELVIP